MPSLVTLAGIDAAIANLGLTAETQKAKLLAAIRRRLGDPEAIQTLKEIPAEELIAEIWEEPADPADPATQKARRKSFSSLKSALNKVLKELAPQGLNPEGVIVGRTNVFEISEEQKSALLEQLGVGGGESGARLAEMFSTFKKVFPEIATDHGAEGLNDLFLALAQAKEVIDGLQGTIREKEGQIVALHERLTAIGLAEGRSSGGQEAALAEVGGAGADGLGPGGEAAGGAVGGEEYQKVMAEEIEEVELAEVGDAGAEGSGPGGEATGEAVGGEEYEEVVAEEEEEVELAEVGDAGPGGIGPGGEATGEEGGGDEYEEVIEEEMEEVELAEEGAAGIGGAGGGGDDSTPQAKLLEVLSKYLDADQALHQGAETLSESEEGVVAQLLERFTPKFIKIPAGRYQFGCPGPAAHEHPLQTITLHDFYLGQYPVTNDLFELFVRETGYETDAEREGYGEVYEGQWRSGKDLNTGRASFTISRLAASGRQMRGASWRHPFGPGSLLEHKHNHPVVQVSRRDAQAFAAWAGKRLPNEAEWEAAARGQEGHRFPWGERWDSGRGNFSSSCLGDTTPVNRYQESGMSPFGIFDLLGNVYEWTTPIEQPPLVGRFVLKGGCWHSREVISACHRKVESETWSNIIGFRLAVSG